jgi:hypothetical protein
MRPLWSWLYSLAVLGFELKWAAAAKVSGFYSHVGAGSSLNEEWRGVDFEAPWNGYHCFTEA